MPGQMGHRNEAPAFTLIVRTSPKKNRNGFGGSGSIQGGACEFKSRFEFGGAPLISNLGDPVAIRRGSSEFRGGLVNSNPDLNSDRRGRLNPLHVNSDQLISNGLSNRFVTNKSSGRPGRPTTVQRSGLRHAKGLGLVCFHCFDPK